MMNDNELMHYGVLGMKLGVHRGRVAQSYGKAVAKRNKLDKRVEVAKAKAQKATVKANTGVSAKYKKLQATSDKYQRKADYIRAQRKAQKWAKQMDKTFKGKNISQMSKKHKDSGKNYVKRRLA